MAKDYYGILGVDKNADEDELKKAYRKLARKYHPDVSDEPDAEEKLQDINAAFEVLMDPQKRAIVDSGGDPYDRAAAGGGAGPGGPFMGFEDIMDAFFGGSMGGFGRRGPRSRRRPGSDALLRLDLDLEQVAFGTESTLTVDTAVVCDECDGACTEGDETPSTCTTCGGSGEVQVVQRTILGQVRTARPCSACSGYGTVITDPCRKCGGEGRVRSRRRITVKVPPGVEDGMRIRLSGEGEVGPGGGPAGDLYVEVHEKPHEVFTRDGADLHCRVRVPMTQAALGTKLNVHTLDDQVEIEVAPGTQPGTIKKVRGAGVPKLRGGGARGDLYVDLDVRTPTKLDTEQEELLHKLATLRDEEIKEVKTGSGFFSKMRDAFNGHA
ncbi:molecular chaperone DnaJ [Glycomyces xiaoerkulensis]|uniref:molecular chaperone DnaJ n=1 Tax=Glycomyces xiaoerkulensis TaxID=2038139 RepID=UPI000C267912|nr:molecular chaperone DnaJ [Glycomyces xiaoerkulensis]